MLIGEAAPTKLGRDILRRDPRQIRPLFRLVERPLQLRCQIAGIAGLEIKTVLAMPRAFCGMSSRMIGAPRKDTSNYDR
jgi:hypothetical protein